MEAFYDNLTKSETHTHPNSSIPPPKKKKTNLKFYVSSKSNWF